MKRKGAISDFTQQRNLAILRAWRRVTAMTPFIHCEDVALAVAQSPSPRFWISEERASQVIYAMQRDTTCLMAMRITKQRMFNDIFNRYTLFRSLYPTHSHREIVSRVIHSPASEFYMEPRYIINIIRRMRHTKIFFLKK